MTTARQPPLWRCPKCGHRFVTRNLWHACGRYRLADHFAGKDPVVRAVFRRFSEVVRACGPVTIYPQKTRIVVQARVRFAGVITRKRWLDAGLWLTRRRSHERLHRVERIVANCYVHTFRFRQPEELDELFAALVREAYAVGRQEHLDAPARRR